MTPETTTVIDVGSLKRDRLAADCINDLNDLLRKSQAQVAALTEACSKAHDWMFSEATIHPDAPAMQLIVDELAAAIAQGEPQE